MKQTIRKSGTLLLVPVLAALFFAASCSDMLTNLNPKVDNEPEALSEEETVTLSTTDGSTEATAVDTDGDGKVDGLSTDSDNSNVEIPLSSTVSSGVYASDANNDGSVDFYLTHTKGGSTTLNTKKDNSGDEVELVKDNSDSVKGFDSSGDDSSDITMPQGLSSNDTVTLPATDGSDSETIEAEAVDTDEDGTVDGLDLDGDTSTAEADLSPTSTTGVYAADTNGDGTADFYITNKPGETSSITADQDGSSTSGSVIVDENGNFSGFDTDGDGTKDTYSIAYTAPNADSGTVPADNTEYNKDDTVEVKGQSDLSRKGYTFNGWNTKADGSGDSYSANDTFTMPAGNVTLYAQWIDEDAPSAPTISGISDGTYNTDQSFTVSGESGATLEYSTDGGSSWSTYSSEVTLSTEGTYTITARQTDSAGNTSPKASTITVTIDKTAPSGYSVSIDQDAINQDNEEALSFTFSKPEKGATYNYTITDESSNTVTGEGSVSSTQITGINVSGLNDGTLTLEVTLTDDAGNTGSTVSDTVTKDTHGDLSFTITINDPNDETIKFDANDDFTVQQGNSFTIKVSESFDSYSWYLDSASTGTGNSINIDTSNIDPGVHKLTVFVEKNSELFSDTIRFTVEN